MILEEKSRPKQKPLQEFKEKLKKRRKGIDKLLLLPNFVEEYTKNKFVLIFFVITAYFLYLNLNVLRINYYTPPEDPLVTKIRENVKTENKIAVQEASMNNKIFEISSSNSMSSQRILSLEFFNQNNRFSTLNQIKELNFYERNNKSKTDNEIQSEIGISRLKHAKQVLRHLTEIGFHLFTNKSEKIKNTNHQNELQERILQDQTETNNNNNDTNQTDTTQNNSNSNNFDNTNNETNQQNDESDSHEIEKPHFYTLTTRDYVDIICFFLLCFSFILISLGNSPQLNISCLMYFNLFLTIAFFGAQAYLLPLNLYNSKILFSSLGFVISSFFAAVTADRFNSSNLIFSNFNADRAFIFREYVYQRLFGRISIFWGMRFGKYQKFEKFFDVQKEFDPKDDDTTDNKNLNQNKKSMVKKNRDIDQQWGNEGNKYLSNKLESFSDIDGRSQVTRPNSRIGSPNISIHDSFDLDEHNRFYFFFSFLYTLNNSKK